MEPCSVESAVEAHPKGVTIRFEVVPGASVVKVPCRYNPWRKSPEAKLTALPERGRANDQLVAEVAKLFGLPDKGVEVLSGHKSSRKVLLVKGVDPKDAVKRLASEMR
jgi:uncharacterized protein (TIGR00251 family)